MSRPDMDDDDDVSGTMRERLAHVETRQETLQESVDDLSTGQEEMIESLRRVESHQIDDETLAEIEKNAKARRRARALGRFVVLLLTLGGGFSGAMVAVL